MRYFEDFKVGEIIPCGSRTVSKEEIIAFALQFDPQPFHIDEAAAKHSMFGGLVASGWHTVCICMRMAVDSILLDAANNGSPGVEKVRWLKPLWPGDTVRAQCRVTGTVPSRSRPDRGRVSLAFEMYNQKDELIMDFVGPNIISRRPAA